MLLGVFLLLQSHAAAQVREIRRVLIFNELGSWSPGVNAIDQEIFAALRRSPYQIEFYSEDLDTSLFPDEASQRQFRDWYFRKYRNRKPDLIIAVGPSPLKFMADSREVFFPNTPIVFWASTEEFAEPPKLDSDFTGVFGVAQPEKTLEAALRLQPGTKHVVVVGGVAPYDRYLEGLVKQRFQRYESKLDFAYLTDLAMPTLLERLKHLPSNTVIYHTSIMEDAAGTHFIDATQSAPMVASAANAPVFAVDDVDVGGGTVGGDVFSFGLAGKVAAGMADRILKGEKPRDIPIVRGASAYIFDWRALKRWGLKESDLPPGSVLLNRQLNFWEAYKRYVIAAIFVLLAQTLVILAILWQRAKRRKTESELRESQDRLEGIIASAMDALIAVDQDQRIVVFNGAAEKMFACSAPDAIGTPIDRFIPPRFRATHGEHIHWFGEDGVSNRAVGALGALWALRANSEEFPIEASISHTEAGGKKLFTVIIRDITERKQAEEARFRHAAIVESSDDAIISLDLDGVIVSWNIAAQHMYGYTEQDALGQPVAMIIPPELREEEGRLLQRLIAGEVIEHNETVHLTKEGKHIDVSLTLSPLRNWAGKIIGISKIARDITLSKLAEASLRESEERFRLVANTAPVMIWMSGPEKLSTYFNQPWLKFTGRSIQEELGSGWAVGVHSEDLERCLDTYRKAYDRREPFEMEYRLRRHDGEYRWVFDLGVPRWNADGSLAGYIGSCLDVTDRKRAEEALSTVSRRLIEAHEEERTWIARELHDDVNQHIALLRITLEKLQQDLPHSIVEVKTSIVSACEQLADLGTDIQGISHRLHSSKLEYLGIVAAANSFCKELSAQHKVEIDFSHADIPRTVSKEVSLCLFRVMQEALQNAVKYSGVRHFTVELRGASGEIHLTVSDTGIGFDPNDAMARQGLGLISMRERLQLVNGVFSLDSELDRGTTIHARVPLRAEEHGAAAAG